MFIVFYLALGIMALIILDSEARMPYDELDWFNFTLLALATWRLTRLMTHDKITAFVREQLYDIKKTGRQVVLEQPKLGPRRVLIDLWSCPYCMSLWTGSVLFFVYLLSEHMAFVVWVLALSAVASALQILLARATS